METLQRTANRGSVSTGYDIDNSCRFDNVFNSGTVADSMVRETGTPSDQTRWTLSCWVKYTQTTDSIVVSKDFFGVNRSWALWSNNYQAGNDVVLVIRSGILLCVRVESALFVFMERIILYLTLVRMKENWFTSQGLKIIWMKVKFLLSGCIIHQASGLM